MSIPVADTTVKIYQEFELDNLIAEMHALTDLTDEEIYEDFIKFAPNISQFEKDYLEAKLGLS